MSPNGRLVHLADRYGRPVCGQKTTTEYSVPGRVTCLRCVACAPRAASRHAHKPIVVGLDFSPLYTALGRALQASATKQPRVRWTHTFVFARGT